MSMSGGGFDSRSSVVFSVTVAMITCSTVFVFSRIASRAGIVKKVLLDDYFILVAWVRLETHLGLLVSLANQDAQSYSPLACPSLYATVPLSVSAATKMMYQIHGRVHYDDHSMPSRFYTTLH